MKHALPSLESLKVFEAAARLLSFSRAANELCITKGAVSYQVRKLEDEIGTLLFKRTVRQVLLTDAGQLLYQRTHRLFAELTETLKRLEPGRSKHVFVGATTYVAARWLSPLIAAYSARYPDVSIVLQHTVNSSEFVLEDIDIAIRWDRCDGTVAGHKLLELPMPLFPACSPTVGERIGHAPRAEDIASIALLCEDRSQDLWEEWAEGFGPISECPRRIIADANVRVQAAIDGQGLVLADELMRTELNSGALVAPFAHELKGYGYVVMSAPSRSRGTNAEALTAWLTSSGSDLP